MMGASMIRSVQNVAVIQSYMKDEVEAVYEVVDEVVTEAGWTQNEDGTWTDPEWPEDSSDPFEDLFHHNLPEELENQILDKLEQEYGRKYPKRMDGYENVASWRALPFIPERRMADGFVLLEDFFVDSSGFGQEGEPALTFQQFVDRAEALITGREERPTYFAITEAGQFQVHIGAFYCEKYEDAE